MTTRLLDLGTGTCAVVAPEPVHDMMRHYVSPFLVPALDHEPDITIVTACDPSAVSDTCRMLADQPIFTLRTSHLDQRYRVWDRDGSKLLVPEHTPDHVITAASGRIVITAERVSTAASISTRAVRQVLMRGGEVRAGQCVHAGAIDLDGHGAIIGGHPGAGKTTVLTRLIEVHGARPVANDRTVLVSAANQRWKAIGVPLAWRFTPAGIGGSPRLSTALTEFEPARGRHLTDGKLELTPWEVTNLLGQPTRPAATVDRIIVLTRSPSAPATKLDAGFIREHLDFGADDFFAEDWLNLRPNLSRNSAGTTMNGDLWSRLAGTVPVLTLAWTDPSELPHVAAAAHREMLR